MNSILPLVTIPNDLIWGPPDPESPSLLICVIGVVFFALGIVLAYKLDQKWIVFLAAAIAVIGGVSVDSALSRNPEEPGERASRIAERQALIGELDAPLSERRFLDLATHAQTGSGPDTFPEALFPSYVVMLANGKASVTLDNGQTVTAQKVDGGIEFAVTD